jgi:hypothetical protein
MFNVLAEGLDVLTLSNSGIGGENPPLSPGLVAENFDRMDVWEFNPERLDLHWLLM